MEYPGVYNDFLAVIDLVNLDIGFILSFTCVYQTDFYDRLLMATIGPMAMLCALACTYRVARRRNGHSEEALSLVRLQHLSVALFVIFVVYSTVSYSVFQTFACDSLDDGNSYLRADYSITCYTRKHTFYKVRVRGVICVRKNRSNLPAFFYAHRLSLSIYIYIYLIFPQETREKFQVLSTYFIL